MVFRKEALFCILLLFLLRSDPSSEQAEILDGYSANSSARQFAYEQRLKGILSPVETEKHSKWLTSRPHRTGTEGARITAEYIKDRLQEYGFRTEIAQYEAYLPAPVSVSIELVSPVRETLPTTEEKVEGDPFTEVVGEHPGWNGYSPSGEATGEVIYAHHGSAEDFRTLKSLGIDVRGKILLMRYFGTGEGTKIRNAERFGAAAVVLYSDPQEDGYRYGDVYPKGNWRPEGSIMRRYILSLPYEGDPLSPGWASLPGARRLQPSEVPLPGIPVLPISYKTAARILGLMAGPVSPHDWQGELPLPYKVGPGPAAIHLRTEMDNRDRPIYNVIARIEGESFPDQWVIVGNHHDAWIFGAGDPSSGTASLLELARGLGVLAQQGYRPRRTLILAFWDAEEMMLGGSTEWVEHHQAELLQKAVACINMDSSVFNPERPLSVSAHPVLHRLFRSVARSVKDPRTGRSTFEVWTDLQNRYRKTPSVDGWGEFFDPETELTEPWIFPTPYDDAEPFFQILALPASDMYYGADYGMYHSIYENYHWMKTVVDPGFHYHVLMSQIQGLVSLRLANAELLPLDYAGEANYWRRAYSSLDLLNGNRKQKVPRLQEALRLIDRWKSEAEAMHSDGKAFLGDTKMEKTAQRDLAELNRKIYLAARDFYRPEGRPGAPSERNLLAGSSYDFEEVSGGSLPGIRFSLDKNDLKSAESETEIYIQALQKRVQSMKSIRQHIRRLR